MAASDTADTRDLSLISACARCARRNLRGGTPAAKGKRDKNARSRQCSARCRMSLCRSRA
jgi:hypothetical protein